jgi:hypothetical protein
MHASPYRFCRVPLVVACLLLVTGLTTVAEGQIWNPLGNAPGGFFGRIPLLGSMVEDDMPGAANPTNPFVYPFYFGGEAYVRPVVVCWADGQFKDPLTSTVVDLHRDANLPARLSYVEFMARVQLSRFSLRGHLFTFLDIYRSSLGRLDQPEFRLGADVDLVSRKGLRFGANLDGNFRHPTFNVTLPSGITYFESGARPVTAGVHLAWFPYGWWGLAPTFEARARWPIVQRTKVTEVEVAGGLKIPATVLGSSGIRGGWRWHKTEIKDFAETEITWSGFFLDYVFFY